VEAPESIPQRDVYSVSRLNREARNLLEGRFPLIWVEGEISNLARPSSGHLYFSLKDAAAQVRCAMFRGQNRYLPFTPKDGMQVLVRVRVSLYEPRGDFQLIAEHMEEAGAGALRRAFEALKQRLASEGLFDEAHKQPLPALPERIGVITSPSGAAIRDILTVLKRRFPAIPVLIYPIPVQGAGAAQEIARTVRLACAHAECDVLILARGGGSLEDLWAFNEETVARAIYDCEIPLVTGIGHEIDFTIADFVADRRAATPSMAAELVTPDQADWQQLFTGLGRRLATLMQRYLAHQGQRVLWLEKRLQHPGRRLQDIAQRLDELEQRMHRARRAFARHATARLNELTAQLHRHTPLHRLRQLQDHQHHLAQRLRTAALHCLTVRRHQFTTTARALEAVSPLATLSRGYAIVSRLAEHTLLRSVDQVSKGDQVEARLAKGRIVCTVDQTADS